MKCGDDRSGNEGRNTPRREVEDVDVVPVRRPAPGGPVEQERTTSWTSELGHGRGGRVPSLRNCGTMGHEDDHVSSIETEHRLDEAARNPTEAAVRVNEGRSGVEADPHERDHARESGRWTIVIPTRAGGERLDRAVDALVPLLAARDEVLVVWDNREPREVPGKDRRIRALEWRGRRGFGPACNRGAREARGELLLFLNDDVVVTDRRVFETLAAALAIRGVGLAGPDVWSDRLRRSESGTSIFWMHGVLETRQGPAAGPGLVPVAYVCGAALAVRRRTLVELGGFDERLAPYYWEDVELSLRLARRGLQAVVVADVQVVHEHGTTIAMEDEAVRRRIYERNRMMVTRRYLPPRRWPSFLLWTALRLCRNLVGDASVARGILDGLKKGSGGVEDDARRA